MSVLNTIEAAGTTDRSLRERLVDGLAAKMAPVFADIHDEIVASLDDSANGSAVDHAHGLIAYCVRQQERIAALASSERLFQTRLANALDSRTRDTAILDFAEALGGDARQLRSDRKALSRWFDADAVLERYHKRLGERERALAHAVERLGPIARDALAMDPLAPGDLGVDLAGRVLTPLLDWRGDARIRQAAYRCLAALTEGLGQWPAGVWIDDLVSATRRTCLNDNEDVWVQCAAFDALLKLSPASTAAAARRRVSEPGETLSERQADDALFVRRHLVGLLAANCTLEPGFKHVLDCLGQDANGAVRQSLALALHRLPASLAGPHVTRLSRDADPQVRAAVFADIPRLMRVCPPTIIAMQVAGVLRGDEDSFVLRMALDAAASLAAENRKTDGPDGVYRQLMRAIDVLAARDLSPKIARWADEARERVWLYSDGNASRIARVLQDATRGRKEAEIAPISALTRMPDDRQPLVGRVMAVLAQNGFGLSVKVGRKPSIQRGEWIVRRLWRILFEARHAATDKRQAHRHTTGRRYHGTLLAPSGRMSELAPTKVPGEPLFEASEGGWRNYLPLLDQVLHSLDEGRTVSLFTSAGVTIITPPRGVVRRTRAFLNLSRRFATLAELRNADPAEYVASLRMVNVSLTFSRYDGVPPNEAIEAMFAKG